MSFYYLGKFYVIQYWLLHRCISIEIRVNGSSYRALANTTLDMSIFYDQRAKKPHHHCLSVVTFNCTMLHASEQAKDVMFGLLLYTCEANMWVSSHSLATKIGFHCHLVPQHRTQWRNANMLLELSLIFTISLAWITDDERFFVSVLLYIT